MIPFQDPGHRQKETICTDIYSQPRYQYACYHCRIISIIGTVKVQWPGLDRGRISETAPWFPLQSLHFSEEFMLTKCRQGTVKLCPVNRLAILQDYITAYT